MFMKCHEYFGTTLLSSALSAYFHFFSSIPFAMKLPPPTPWHKLNFVFRGRSSIFQKYQGFITGSTSLERYSINGGVMDEIHFTQNLRFYEKALAKVSDLNSFRVNQNYSDSFRYQYPSQYEKRFVSRLMKNGQKSIRPNPI